MAIAHLSLQWKSLTKSYIKCSPSFHVVSTISKLVYFCTWQQTIQSHFWGYGYKPWNHFPLSLSDMIYWFGNKAFQLWKVKNVVLKSVPVCIKDVHLCKGKLSGVDCWPSGMCYSLQASSRNPRLKRLPSLFPSLIRVSLVISQLASNVIHFKGLRTFW